MDYAYFKKSKSDPTFRKRATVDLTIYIFLIIWTYIEDEAIVNFSTKKGDFCTKLGSIQGEYLSKDN